MTAQWDSAAVTGEFGSRQPAHDLPARFVESGIIADRVICLSRVVSGRPCRGLDSQEGGVWIIGDLNVGGRGLKVRPCGGI